MDILNLFLTLLVCEVYSFRNFHNGNGFLSLDEFTQTDKNVTSNVFMQHLDHYDPTNKILWQQRYYVNTEFFKKDRRDTAFLYIGGEGVANSKMIEQAACYEAAKKYGGILFSLEHRFYGKSQPFSDLSTSNLRYLHSQQALEDLATFIDAMNEAYNTTSDVKWIVFGGSYAGSLAAWLRLKYPHLVHGAVSSSAPLFSKLEFPEYLQVVADDLASNSQECVENINLALGQLEEILISGGEENITSLFNLCSKIQLPLNNNLDRENLYEYIIDSFAYIAQSTGLNKTIDNVCEMMNSNSTTKQVDRLGEVVKFINGDQCFQGEYKWYIEDLKNITTTDSGMMRQWWYQTCSEFGWYQISNNENKAFGDKISLDFFMNLCKDVYGDEFNKSFILEQIKKTNINYGGFDIKVSNTVFIQESVDPWHTVGLTDNRTKEYSTIFINGTSHCSDLYSANDSDLKQLTDARKEVSRLIGVWLEVNHSGGKNKQLSLILLYILLGYVGFTTWSNI